MGPLEQLSLHIRRALRPVRRLPDSKRILRATIVGISYFILLLVFGFAFARMQGVPIHPGAGEDHPAAEIGNVIDDSDIRNTIIEFGDPDKIINNEKPLLTYIRFPRAGGFTDQIIQDWANTLYQEKLGIVNEKVAIDASITGELNIHFDSFIMNERFVGVREMGIFYTTNMANPEPILQVFNFDLDQEKVISNEEILDFTQVDIILSVLQTRMQETYPDAIIDTANVSWLDYIMLSHEGLIVLLPRATALAASYGEIEIVIPYHVLGSALLLTELLDIPYSDSSEQQVTDNVIPPVTQGQRTAIDPTRPMVALTFDDGPSRHTTELLNILEAHGAYATFCVIGNLIDARASVIRDAYQRGHEIIGHSWDHLDLTSLDETSIRNEIQRPRETLLTLIEDSPMIYRPPFGANNERVRQISANLGYSLLMWNLDTEDWSSKDVDQIYTMVMDNVQDGDIILAHDIYGTTIEAFKRIIPALVEQGFQLVTVSDLLLYHDILPEAGQRIYSARQVQ